MKKKIVAIIGRPNVGKSSLFNVLTGEKIAIIENTPGVTRDRIYAECQWRDIKFQLVDTGGIDSESDDIIHIQMRRQAEVAMDMADVIIFLTDIKAGVVAEDDEIANMIRKTKKPVILVCNKVDNVGKTPNDIYEFYNLGLGNPIPISAKAKLGIGELLDEIYEKLDKKENVTEDIERIKVAIIGKPNVGKSSLINKILGEERAIVSEIAGTTRDAIDSRFDNKFGKYLFIDTAGIRRKNKVYESIEKYSIIKAKAAIDKSDVAIIVIDAKEGATDQDEKIAGYAHEKGKAIIIAINKWDLINKDEISLNEYSKNIRKYFKFMSYAPLITISAMTGQRITNIFSIINKVYKSNNLRINTSVLNEIIIEMIAITPPPTDKGNRLKILYVTQVKSAPPTIVVFVNDKKLAHFSYVRHIENTLRKSFDLEGTPIKIIVRQRSKKSKDVGG